MRRVHLVQLGSHLLELSRLLALIALQLAMGLNKRLLQSFGLVYHGGEGGSIQLGRSLGAFQARGQLSHALFDAGGRAEKSVKR